MTDLHGRRPAALDRATGTYRLQLRGEMDFAMAAGFLPYLQTFRITHLYLSPIFTATEGSTHGYDVRRPDEIDPVLGGQEGFERLAAQASAAGIAIILDIVPNHTAFSLENPWLCDVLRLGPESRYAGHFDIDYGRPVLLPFLKASFETMAETEPAHVAQGAEGEELHFAGMVLPLRPGSAVEGPLTPDGLRALHARQHWRLAYWEMERDRISHRRFFNVTQLIGMRVEEPEVFQDMHALVFDLVDRGLVQGLRVDHVDGLADPARYLDRLATRLPGCPIWVEKILTGDEELPRFWPVVGTTGYEAAVRIDALLADAAGVARLTELWRAETGGAGSFHETLLQAKREVIEGDLAAELLHLIALAEAVVEAEPEVEAGPESLREALLALLVETPRYRTYFSDAPPEADDLRVWQETVTRAGASLRSDRLVAFLGQAIAAGTGTAARRLRQRFQQVTGALLAKSHEDTAFFRYTPYLAANEVGGDPDAAVLDPAAFEAFCRQRLATFPAALTLTTSHDTKRAEDARARLIAMSHLPEAFMSVWREAQGLAEREGLSPVLAWYAVQSALAIWEPGRDDLSERLTAHLEKAMREAKEVTSWTHPDPAEEAPVLRFADALIESWRDRRPEGLDRLCERAEALSLCQWALKLAIPGLPDIYRGTERGAFWLTDPDNRQPVALRDLTLAPDPASLAGRKEVLLGQLMQLRAAEPDLFLSGSVALQASAGGFRLLRRNGGSELRLDLRPKEAPEGAVRVIWRTLAPASVRAEARMAKPAT